MSKWVSRSKWLFCHLPCTIWTYRRILSHFRYGFSCQSGFPGQSDFFATRHAPSEHTEGFYHILEMGFHVKVGFPVKVTFTTCHYWIIRPLGLAVYFEYLVCQIMARSDWKYKHSFIYIQKLTFVYYFFARLFLTQVCQLRYHKRAFELVQCTLMWEIFKTTHQTQWSNNLIMNKKWLRL